MGLMATEPNLEKQIFTTFEVARICNANITSIKNWIEKGNLRAFRTPGGHFRIERAVLIDFLDRFGMPNPFVVSDERSVVVLCEDPGTIELVRRTLGAKRKIHGTDDPIEAALLVGEIRPDCFLLDLKLSGSGSARMVERIRARPEFSRLWIVAWRGPSDTVYEAGLTRAGVNRYVLASEGVDVLTQRVAEGLA